MTRRPRAGGGSLGDLAALRETLERRRRADAAAAAEAAARRAAEPQAVAERARQHFTEVVGPVHPLRVQHRADVRGPRPAPWPRQREADERAALREALSDEVDVESLLWTDDGLSYRRPGIGPEVVTELRRGRWSIQGQLDLHGLTRDEARDALAAYVRDAMRRGQRCVRVVHGKGHGSPGRQPVLKARVQRWLAQCAEVVAFAQASGPQGGAGALIVLLAGSAPARGSRRRADGAAP